MGAFALLVEHNDPVCSTKLETGEVLIDDDPTQVSSGTRTIDADSGVVQAGCTSDTVAWWQAAGSLALSGAAVLAADAGPSGDAHESCAHRNAASP